jgi:hypothetical protein
MIYSKLKSLRLESVSWPDGRPLSEVIRYLNEQSKLLDPEKKGINFMFKPNVAAKTNATGTAPETVDASAINVKLVLNDVSLQELLVAVELVADHPIKYSVEDYGVVISAKLPGPEPPILETRAFKVDTNTFFTALPNVPGVQIYNSATVSEGLESLLNSVGVDLTAHGRIIVFNFKLGLLFVKATPSELDTIERVVQALNQVPPQIHIKARFMEVPESDVESVWKAGVAVDIKGTNKVEIITATNETIQLRKLESHSGFENLADPEAITTSGRQTMMRATVLQTIVTGINPLALKSPGVSSNELFLTERVECGPTFDVAPYVLSDGYTINLTAIASVIEFLGYAKPTNSVTAYVDGQKQTVPVPLPKFRVREMSTPANLFDGQTLILSGPATSVIQTTKDKVPFLGDLPLVGGLFRSQTETSVRKNLIVLVTVTIVDPAGNRVHSNDELPFNPATIPPQPKNSTPSP